MRKRGPSAGIRPDWKKILSLCEELISQETVEKQIQFTKSIAETWFRCQVEIWVDATVLSALGHGIQFDFYNNAKVCPEGLMQQVYQKKETVFSREQRLTSDAENHGSSHKPILAAAFPLIAHNQLLGVFKVTREQGHSFKEKELDLIEGLVSQSAIAIHIKCQLLENNRKLELLTLVRSVSAQIADLVELDELSRRVTSLILLTFKYYYVAIFTTEVNQDQLRFRDSAGPLIKSTAIGPNDSDTTPIVEQFSPKISVQLGEGIIGYAAKSGKEIIANDIRQESHFRIIASLPDTKSELAIPLIVEDRILGVIDIQSDRLNAFGETDILVLRVLANNIAAAVENARLYGDVRQRVEQLAIVTDINKAISSILELDQLFKEFIYILHERLKYPFIHIFDVHEGRRKLFYQAGDGTNDPKLNLEDLSLDLDAPKGLVSASARLRKTMLSNDVSLDPMYSPSLYLPTHTLSELAMPLIFGNSIIGVLDIQSDRKFAFTEDDVSLLEALADNLSVAMRNASLYRSEAWRRQVAESMREVASQLTAGSEFDQNLRLILSELQKTLPCDFAAIWLNNFRGEYNPRPAKNSGSYLRLVAVYVSPDMKIAEQDPSENILTSDEIIEICNRSELLNPWLSEVLQSDQPVIRQPGPLYETLGAILNFPEDYSAIAAPLQIADRPIGVLILGHQTAGRYGHEAQTMTATFASYAAVAIENTRLLEAAHDQAWISTVLLQVSEATQSINSLEELLTNVVNITPTLIGIDICMIFLWDNMSRMFIPMAQRGLDEDQKDVFTHCVISEGEHPIFDRLLTSGKVVFYDGESTLRQAEVTHLFDILITFNLDRMNFAIFPMIAHGEFLGAFIVNYHATINNNQDSIDSIKDDFGLDEKFSIIQGISHQTAVAAENIQLIKSQREEAYVSVALLQVAQAVVSTNSIEEILESIVRLTPILTGIKRCVIYLWDELKHQYKLSQSYGISKNELNNLQKTYKPEDYRLLDIVRRSNSFAYHEIKASTESPADWNNLDLGDIVGHENNLANYETGKNLDYRTKTTKKFIKSNHPLLMAYPLTVKGMVLGVMLFEEPDSANAPVTHNMREKRHEISVGITQQAALAIQNDHFQQEIVEQERMERELQLAREIQQTFLPESKPILDGWDLEARWQPAREVGGDFYDFFELPGNRLGIVIADVADKGMPAALFMTLSRTLLRSSAREYHSPAVVLEHVNDLLVSDTKRGLFVTVVYGVLSLQTGELVYANAGHNRPIIFHPSEKELKILPTTGMALGILPGIAIQENRVSISYGDSVILYTDGITEAFSADGEMFGESRLYDAIRECMKTNARDIANYILETLNRFIEDTSPSDDITMITLCREGQDL